MEQHYFLRDKRILLVNDEQEVLDMLVSLLHEEGFSSVFTAITGKEAIAHCHAYNPELAILDIILPDAMLIDDSTGNLYGVISCRQRFLLTIP